jgi:acyl-CoA hydrolase
VVAINNCVEMDLFGQVCSESSGTRQISGTGGQLDFTYGAYRSKGGKAFLCMSSTFDKKGTALSRIKPLLTEGTIVTIPRSMVSYVVTEYGIVNLKGMSTWQRAEAIVSLAHPDFRESLIQEAEKMGIWRRSNPGPGGISPCYLPDR